MVVSILFVAGVVLSIMGTVLFLVAAFRESVLWGIGCLLFSPISLVFLILHWREAKNAFFIQLAGVAFVLLGMLMSTNGS